VEGLPETKKPICENFFVCCCASTGTLRAKSKALSVTPVIFFFINFFTIFSFLIFTFALFI